jgi:hypothetical protein
MMQSCHNRYHFLYYIDMIFQDFIPLLPTKFHAPTEHVWVWPSNFKPSIVQCTELTYPLLMKGEETINYVSNYSVVRQRIIALSCCSSSDDHTNPDESEHRETVVFTHSSFLNTTLHPHITTGNIRPRGHIAHLSHIG